MNANPAKKGIVLIVHTKDHGVWTSDLLVETAIEDAHLIAKQCSNGDATNLNMPVGGSVVFFPKEILATSIIMVEQK